MNIIRKVVASAWLAALMLAVTAIPATADAQAAAGTPSMTAGTDVDAAGMWSHFLATANVETVYPAYDLIEQVGYDGDNVDSEACRAQQPALVAAVAAASVSIALHHVAMLCAQALGDATQAALESRVLEALSGHAVAQISELSGATPVQVLAVQDAYTLVDTLGLETTYAYYLRLHVARDFPFVIAAWDPEDKIERHITFDLLDGMNAISRSDPYAGFPYERTLLADSVLQGQQKGEQLMAVDILAVRDASMHAGPARIERLRSAAGLGGIQSTGMWLLACDTTPFAGCADGLVDALLPHAEEKKALPVAQLAYAYMFGLGVDKDEAAAAILLDAADRRWPRGGASAWFATMWLASHTSGDVPAVVQQRSEHARQQGNRNIGNMLLYRFINSENKPTLDATQLADLADAERSAGGAGAGLLASYHQKNENAQLANQWLFRAARDGDVAAQSGYGFKLLDGDGVEKDPSAAETMLRRAAQGGSASAMRYMSYRGSADGKWKDAMSWLMAAAVRGDIPALLQLAGIMEYPHPGLEEDQLPRALQIYTSLADDNDVAEARRRLAQMAIDGRGMPKSPTRARAWLLQDAEKGDHESEARLAAGYLSGELGKVDEAEGVRWMDKALQAKTISAYGAYGSWLYFTKKTPDARQRAMVLWRQGHELRSLLSTNNLAWALCTSPHAEVRNPSEGLDFARKIGDLDRLDATELDTVAACHAAAGDYPRAIEVQAQALAKVEKLQAQLKVVGHMDEPAFNLAGYQQRLVMYRAGKPYVDPRGE